MSIRKRGGKYQVRIGTFPNRTFPTLEAAQAVEAEMKLRLAMGDGYSSELLEALPVAQEERPYLVYVVEGPHAVKVGITGGDMERRLHNIRCAAGIAELQTVGLWQCERREQAYEIEQGTHAVLREHRLIGEWFSCSVDVAMEAVQQVIDHGHPKWAEILERWNAARNTR